MQSPLGRRTLGAIFAFAAGTLGALTPSNARADMPRLTVDWGHLLHKGEDFVRAETEAEQHSPHASSVEASRVSGVASGPQLGTAWFGVAPSVSLVARDWGSARSIAGGPIALTDAMRLSRSCRMVLSRIRLGNGRIVPFSQLGLGQWRVDTDLVPHLPRSVELAGQFGGGLEVHVMKDWEVAAEADLTVLYREGMHEPQQVLSPRLWGTFVASRIKF